MIRAGAILMAGIAAVIVAGCGVRPARSDVPVTPARPLSGSYLATIHTAYVGPVRARMIAEPTEVGFKANTSPGVAWTLLGGVEKLLGPVFTPYLFPSGMILTWRSTLPGPDGPGSGTIGVGSASSMRASTTTVRDGGPTEVRWKDGRLVAMIELQPLGPDSGEFSDYRALAGRVREEISRRYFSPEIAASRAMRSYLDDLADGAAKANDDVEFLFAAMFAARKNIARFGTPLIYPGEASGQSPFGGSLGPPRPYVVTADTEAGFATLRIDAFMDDATIDRAMDEVFASGPRALILDLRTCPGVQLSILRAAARLAEGPVQLGTYFEPPHSDIEAREFEAETGAAANAELGLRGAARLVSVPSASAFAGPVAILTSKRTSSTAEVLAASLTASGRACTVGENTAGRPMLSREVSLGQGWMMRLATFDYRPPTGSLLTPRGLPPTIRCSAKLAPAAAAEFLRHELSAPGGSSPRAPR